jgi:RHS repeat-associated protein
MGTNGTEVVDQSQLFSSRGTVKRQYLPYQPPSPDFVPAPEALPHKSLFYDALGRLIRIENADGTFVKQAFEPGTAFLFDEEDVRVDAGAAHAGTPRRHIYDPTGRIQEVALNQEGSWLPTRYVYDVKGNLLLEESPTGQQTTFAYDFLGRRLQTQSAATGKTVFVFDANGNQVSKSDSGAEVVNFEFDELDRLKRTVYRDTGEVAAAYLYHDTSGPAAPEAGPFSKGRLVKVNYPDGELVFGYDAMGNVIRKTIRPASLPGQDLVFDYTFRADGKVDSILYPAPAPGGGRMLVRYEYNQRGLLLRVPGYVSTIAYNPAGQRTSITFGNGVVSAYGYEEASFRLLSLHTGNGGGEVLQDLQYQYDQTGNVLAVLSPDPKRAARFVYDDLYQLIQATTEAGLSWSYAYDEESNLTQKSDVGAYGYDAAGRLTSAGAGVFSYTATGQMAAAPWGNCTYDPSGRLRKIVKGAEEMSCHYDQDGRRTRVQVTGGAADYAFLTPDELVSIENGTVFAYLMDGPVRFAQIRLDSNAVSYLHGDHLSSTSVVTGPAGQVLQQVYYDPFGGILENSLAAGTPGAHHLYAGQVLDAWSGLVYMHSRYYHAGLGRFTSPDNLVPELYQPQAWNRYCYVQNNPMRFIDPTGHFWEEIGDWFEDNWQNIVAAVVAVIVIIAVVVLTIVTFGAAALIGVGIAMAIGGIIGGISAGVAGGDILTGILVGMAVGGLAAFGGMGIGAGMAAVFGKGTFLAAVATGALSGAVSGAAMGFAAGFAGGQGSAGEIWERVWQGALVGAVSGAILGVGSGLFKAGVLGSGKLGFATLTKESLIKAGTGLLAGGAAELGRQYASGKSTDQLEWGKILGAGAGGAALGSFVKFGGNSGLPILDFLKPEYVGISSSIFAMLPSGVFVLGYADDLWNLLKSNEAKTPDIKGSF